MTQSSGTYNVPASAMIPPGWNVTEPIGVAVKIVRIIEALKNAPEETKVFAHRLESFRKGLNTLQKILEGGADSSLLREHVDELKSVVEESQTCVQRCEVFITSVQKPAGWVWKKDQANRLSGEIDSRLHDLSFGMQLVTLYGFRMPSSKTY